MGLPSVSRTCRSVLIRRPSRVTNDPVPVLAKPKGGWMIEVNFVGSLPKSSSIPFSPNWIYRLTVATKVSLGTPILAAKPSTVSASRITPFFFQSAYHMSFQNIGMCMFLQTVPWSFSLSVFHFPFQTVHFSHPGCWMS